MGFVSAASGSVGNLKAKLRKMQEYSKITILCLGYEAVDRSAGLLTRQFPGLKSALISFGQVWREYSLTEAIQVRADWLPRRKGSISDVLCSGLKLCEPDFFLKEW